VGAEGASVGEAVGASVCNGGVVGTPVLVLVLVSVVVVVPEPVLVSVLVAVFLGREVFGSALSRAGWGVGLVEVSLKVFCVTAAAVPHGSGRTWR